MVHHAPETPQGLSLRSGCVPSCRACAHRDLEAQKSEAKKQDWVGLWLSPFCEPEIIRSVPEEQRWGYRDKVTLRARLSLDGCWEFGMRRRTADGWDFVSIADCPVQTSRVNAILRVLAGLPRELPLLYVSIAGSLVTLVLKSALLPSVLKARLQEGAGELARAGVAGVFANLNPAAGNRVFFAKGWVHLWGEKRGKVLGELVHGPGTFQQPIERLYREAVSEAARFLRPVPGDSVLDLYSGIGATLKVWTDEGARSIGVELDGEAAALAGENVPGALCLRGRVEDRIPQLNEWLAEGRERGEISGTTLAFLNPPRMGLGPEVARWLSVDCRPARIAYLSCNPKTQARDLSLFRAAGYAVKRIIPYDFFPQTFHVESLALLDSARGFCGAPASGLPSGAHG